MATQHLLKMTMSLINSRSHRARHAHKKVTALKGEYLFFSPHSHFVCEVRAAMMKKKTHTVECAAVYCVAYIKAYAY